MWTTTIMRDPIRALINAVRYRWKMPRGMDRSSGGTSWAVCSMITIVAQHGDVKRTAPAASIWSTGPVGATVAYDRYDSAFVFSLITFITLRVLTPIKRNVTADNEQADHA